MVRVCPRRIRRRDTGERCDQPQHARATELGGRLPSHVCGPRWARLRDTTGVEVNGQRVPRAVFAVDVAIQCQRRNGSLRDRRDPTATLQKALASSRIPTCFTIPISVALRVLPVIGHEVKAISDAMKLRGMSMLSLRAAQYFTIPLLSTVVRSGDELASAALVRGLGGTTKPTSVTVVKFRVIDAVILLVVISFAIWRIVL